MESIPSGAALVLLHGAGVRSSLGTAPARSAVPPGEYTLLVSLDGYFGVDRQLAVGPHGLRIDLDLEPRLGYLTIRADPDFGGGHEIRIDGASAGRSPMRGIPMAAGRLVSVEVGGVSQVVTLDEGDRRRAEDNADLERKNARRGRIDVAQHVLAPVDFSSVSLTEGQTKRRISVLLQ